MNRKKLTALFLTLAFIFNFLEYTTPTRTAFSDIVDVVITCDGMEENSITMSENEKITLTASEERAEAYQWQIQLPYSELWVDIFDKTDCQCEIGYTLLEPCLNEDNTAKLRCQAEIGDTEYSSDEITVLISKDALMPTFPENFHAEMMSQLQPNILDDEPDSGTRTVTIKYFYYNEAPDATSSVANDYVATIAKGESYSRKVQSPVRTGYKAYIATINEWNAAEGKWLTDLDETLYPYDEDPKNGSAVNCSVSNIQDDVVYYVIYIPQEVEFHVSRYQQNIYDDLYTFVDSETRSAKVGTIITNESDIREAFEGFSILQYNDATVAADGSTLIEIFYDREYHLMNFQLDGGYGVEPVYARYGTEFRLNTPTKPGYTFNGWVASHDGLTAEQITIADSMAAALKRGEMVSVPSFDIVFNATWTTENTSATVVFWYENADDDGYSYAGSETVTKKSGSTINSNDYKETAFTGRDSTHFTYNPEKAESVVVNGDGSSVLNVYFTRNVYNLIFADGNGLRPENYGSTGGYEKANSSHPGYENFSTIRYFSGYATMYRYQDSNNKFHFYLYIEGGNLYYLGSSSNNTINGLKFIADERYRVGDLLLYPIALQNNDRQSITIGQQTFDYSGNLYQVITAKYQAKIHDKWPLAGSHFAPYTAVPENYYCWYYGNGGNQLSKVYTLTSNFCNSNGTVLTLDTKNNIIRYHAAYMTESLYGNVAGAVNYNGTYYLEDFRYSQEINLAPNSSLNPKSIDGFNGITSVKKDSTITLYYQRKRYNIDFYDNHGANVGHLDDVMFEMPMSSLSVNGKAFADFVPDYPSSLEEGAYYFDGWYTTSGCYDGTEANFETMTMPNDNLAFYAKWTPITHNVKFYESYNDMISGDMITNTSYGTNDVDISHRTPVQYASTIARNGYNFVGWFYIDEETGEKKAFLPNNMPVTKDLKLYAEWTANKMIYYTIKYMGAEAVKDANGEYLMPDGRYTLDTSNSKPVALETTGQFQDGRTKTFSAKTMNELYSDYSSKYFPIISSHAIMFMDDTDETDHDVTVKHNEDGSYSIEYTFYYVYLEKSKYTVEYINSETGDNIFPSGTVPGITVETENSVVTERFKDIPNYSPDEYQKRLILTADPSQNVIRFYYTPNDKPTYYIEHLTENLDGTWTIQASEFSSGSSGETITRSPNSYTGHIFDKEHEWVDTQGEPLTIGENEKWAETADFSNNQYSYDLENGKTLVIRFYYPLEEYNCTIEHRILSSKEYLFGTEENSTETVKGKYGARFEGDATKVRDEALALGYWVDGSNTDETRLHQSKIVTESNNVITFWYVDEPIEINYRVKIKDKIGMNVYGNFVTPTLDNTNSHKVNDQLQGSTPHLVAGYHFVNWYKDEECEQAVDSSWITDGNKLTPAPEGENNIIKAATYYAKIDPNTLTIKKTGSEVNENDTFLFKVTGNGVDLTVSIKGTGSAVIEFIPNGTYTVEEVSKWSWEYNAASSQTVTVTDSGTVTFTNTKDTTKRWLSGESSINNKFSAFGN